MRRREFIGTMAALACARAFSMPTGTAIFDGPRLKIGIVSDIHIIDEDIDHGYCGGTETLEKAFAWFRDQGADGIMIAGDLADWGLVEQLKKVGKAWNKIFPKNKGLGGKRVEKLFVYGNHDIEGWSYGYAERYNKPEELFSEAHRISTDRAAIWKKCFGEKYIPIWIKDIKGYKFIGAHYQDWEGIHDLDKFLDSVKNQLPTGSKPFFYTQHVHLKDTCSSPWVWGQGNGDATAALSKYPNAIAFTGHSHTPLTDERTIWQGTFTSVGTASLRYECPFGGHENAKSDGGNDQGQAMPAIDMTDGRAGMLMTVYDDCVTLTKRDFYYDEPLGDDWVIPLGDNAALSFAKRAAEERAPQFPNGSKLKIEEIKTKNRKGDEIDAVTVSFPSVLKQNTGLRAFDYEVTASTVNEFGHSRIMSQKRVFSNGFYKGEKQDTKNVSCVFDRAELVRGVDMKRVPPSFRFEVRPCGAFGAKGDAITAEIRLKS